MIIVKPSVELIGMEFPACLIGGKPSIRSFNPQLLIEEAGRVCYKSEDLMTDESNSIFVQKIQRLGHESVIEHSCVTLRIICDTGISHEIVRHRVAAYSQESSRFCNYQKSKFGSQISLIEPPGLTYRQKIVWAWAMRQAERAYKILIALGASPQIARAVLPKSLKTELIWTCNFREWKHIIKLRTNIKAHPQMIDVAKMIEDIMKVVAPDVFNTHAPQERES